MTSRWMLALLLALFYVPVHAATDSSSFATTVMSEATNIPLHGWNRVLMLRNGKTVVLHLAPREKMIVKIFDEAHKEVASIAQYFKIIGEADLAESQFKGFYDIDGVPTLFIAQDIDNHYSLLRVRFTPESGKLLDEKIIFESPGRGVNNFQFRVSKSPETDEYAFICYKGSERDFPVFYFNKEHRQVRKSFFRLPRNAYLTDMELFEFSKSATFIGVSCVAVAQQPNKIGDNLMIVGKMTEDDTTFNTQEFKLSLGNYPAFLLLTRNVYNNTIDVALGTYANPHFRDKGFIYYKDAYMLYFAVLNEDMSVRTFNEFKYASANKYLSQYRGNNASYSGFPLFMFTNKFGVTMLLSESHLVKQEKWGKTQIYTRLDDACLTKFNEEGEEISGVVIGKSQCAWDWVGHTAVMLRKTNKALFNNFRYQDDDRQYISMECLSTRNVNYLFFNDYVSNEGKTLRDRPDTVFSFEKSEAICYKVNGNDEIERQYLFGKPGADESRALLLESMDQHADEKKFSALICVRRGKEKRMHLAWCTLN